MINVERLKSRFLKYVQIWSQSQDDVEDRYPSTPQQLEIAAILRDDMLAMGLQDVKMDEWGYVTATLPANPPDLASKPVVGLIAHYDTYPGVSGQGVKPIIHDYKGGDIVLPDDPEVIIVAEETPALAPFVGSQIITASGTTLLGADDKAGVAEILEAAAFLMEHPEIAHGTIRIGFTPDEEVGAGTAHFDVAAFGANVAYTLDGSLMGEVEDETFSADGAKVKISGRDFHPGYAKGKMLNAVRIAARFIECLPKGLSPECTEGREFYLHPMSITGDTSNASITYIVRAFEVENLARLEDLMKIMAESMEREFPGSKVEVEIKEQYRNMLYHLQKEPRAVSFAVDAVKMAGIAPIRSAIRGGTDGARLSAMGLPTPNLFAGGVNFHSKQEWVAVPAMEKAVETVVNIVQLWAQRG